MKKFLKNVLAFAVVFFLIEKVFFIFLFISPSLERDTRLEEVINGEINKDIIVLGSSVGARNIIAKQIEDSLHMSAYNLSYPGSDIEFHEFLLQTLLLFNETPKTVLLTVDDPDELLPSDNITFRYERLYPLAKYNYVNSEMIKREEKTLLSKFLVLSRINKSNFVLKEIQYSDMDTIAICGSMPVSFPKRDFEFSFNAAPRTYNSTDELPGKIESFLRIQELCTKNDIELCLVFPPIFEAYNPLFENRLRQLSNPEVSFYVYDTLNKTYRDKTFFHDETHLQKHGAVIFTNDIIETLKQ